MLPTACSSIPLGTSPCVLQCATGLSNAIKMYVHVESMVYAKIKHLDITE